MNDIKRPLKKSLIGFELELFTINRDGFIVNAADQLLKKAKRDGNISLKKEISMNMVEIASSPNKNVPSTMEYLLQELEYLASIAEDKNIFLCPLGTYPGSYEPIMRTDTRYGIQKSILGDKYKIAGRCAGLHCHYTLPRGIFDSQLRVLKLILRSKIKESVVNSYNFLIAADPALTCLMQSSPYYQGRYIGKDSRVIMYRGGSPLNSPEGLYADFEEFGALPHYKLTALDIMDIITTRYEKWKSYIKGLGLNLKVLSLYGSILYTNWSPVRISAHGTIEQRGMDINHPRHVAGIGVITRSLLKKLQEEYYSVVPSEIGIKTPFKVEKDIIYIPPFQYVRDVLQKLSAYKGLEDERVHNYCKNFLKLAQSAIKPERLKLIEPFQDMVAKKKTISDEIIDFARKRGFKDKKEPITNEIAAEIALVHSQRLLTETEKTKKLIKDLI